MPITKTWYFNDAYGDSDSNRQEIINTVITDKEFDKLRIQVKEKRPLPNYDDLTLSKKCSSTS
jgi:hypothetical protein